MRKRHHERPVSRKSPAIIGKPPLILRSKPSLMSRTVLSGSEQSIAWTKSDLRSVGNIDRQRARRQRDQIGEQA